MSTVSTEYMSTECTEQGVFKFGGETDSAIR